MVHCSPRRSVASPRPIAGSATLTAVESRKATPEPRMAAARTLRPSRVPYAILVTELPPVPARFEQDFLPRHPDLPAPVPWMNAVPRIAGESLK